MKVFDKKLFSKIFLLFIPAVVCFFIAGFRIGNIPPNAPVLFIIALISSLSFMACMIYNCIKYKCYSFLVYLCLMMTPVIMALYFMATLKFE